MSWINLTLNKLNNKVTDEVSKYSPTKEENNLLNVVRAAMQQGYQNMTTPRREFSDLSLLERVSVDNMSWNSYQPNDGAGFEGDVQNSWRSNALRPIVRNKAISVTAHITARLVFPKVFAQNKESEEDKDAAMVMEDLVEYGAQQAKYPRRLLEGVINAIVNPYSIMHVEYVEAYRTVKDIDENGKITKKEIKDEEYCGFNLTPVLPAEIYFENFYENEIQRQGYIIWRKVISYSQAVAKYGKKYASQFKFVKPGMQVMCDDPNNTFYYVYDTNLTGDLVEEVMYWNRNEDLYSIVCNGVLLTDPENPNPRADKKYPFAKTFYEYINTNCFAGKSLVFKMGPDARIINELYPMIIDGTYLQVFPPMFIKGSEEIGTDVIIPGAVTILSNPDSDLSVINTGNNIASGMNTMSEVIRSINQSSLDPMLSGDSTPGTKTAYESAKLQQNGQTDLGLFMRMIGFFVEDIGTLMVSDILQYMTIADVEELTNGDMNLKYQSFLLPEKQTASGLKSRKIMFDNKLPSEPIPENEIMDMSYDVMGEEGGPDSKKEILKVNPEIFRELKYKIVISADTMNPMSDEIERALNLEAYDRAIANPRIAQDPDALDAVTRDFLLGVYPQSKGNPDKYLPKAQPMQSPEQPLVNTPGVSTNASASNILSKVAQTSGAGMPIPPRPSVGA